MRRSEVELWTVAVLDRVAQGLRVEDDAVELKRELPPDFDKVARRIAGHANQARSERILWIIGASDDDGGSIPGVGEMADITVWWSQVKRKFDEVAPEPHPVHVSFDGRQLLAIGFETDRVPYVLRLTSDNPNREVPWREANGVRSANRSDLLRLLVPASRLPSLSVLSGTLSVERHDDDPATVFYWSGDIDVYADCPTPATFPDHRAAAWIEFGGKELPLTAQPEVLGNPHLTLARSLDGQLLLEGSTAFQIAVNGRSDYDEITVDPGSRGRLMVVLGTAGSDPRSIHLAANLSPTQPGSAVGAWDIES